jgi:uncharacterized membrane protein
MEEFKEGIEDSFKTAERLEAFSDAVFAIAITLLILELIDILHTPGGDKLGGLLLNNWGSFLAFITGFLTILICWINHHAVVSHIKKAETGLMWVNGFVLLVVTFTPFPTYVLSEYISKEPHLAIAIFGFNYFMMSIAAYCLTAYAYKKKLIEQRSKKIIESYKRLYACSVIYTLLVLPVCFISIPLSVLFYCVLFVLFAFPDTSAPKISGAFSFIKTHRFKRAKKLKHNNKPFKAPDHEMPDRVGQDG